MEFPSKLIDGAVNELSKLPGVGRRTALRFVLHLLRYNKNQINTLTESLLRLQNGIRFCKICNSLSDEEICNICSNPGRNLELICVTEDIRDMIAVENTGQFYGVYHILGGLISPLEGLGPDKLNIEKLIQRVKTNKINEILFALPATVEGDTTGFYLFKQLQHFNIKITTLSKGISIGEQLEFTDEVTLGRSLLNRLPYETTIVKSCT